MLFEEAGDMVLWLLMAFSFSAGACFGAVMLSLFVTQPILSILSAINRSNVATPLTDRINHGSDRGWGGGRAHRSRRIDHVTSCSRL